MALRLTATALVHRHGKAPPRRRFPPVLRRVHDSSVSVALGRLASSIRPSGRPSSRSPTGPISSSARPIRISSTAAVGRYFICPKCAKLAVDALPDRKQAALPPMLRGHEHQRPQQMGHGPRGAHASRRSADSTGSSPSSKQPSRSGSTERRRAGAARRSSSTAADASQSACAAA